MRYSTRLEARANCGRFPTLRVSNRDLKGIPLQGGCAGITAVSTDTSAGKPRGAVPARGRAQRRGEAAALRVSAEVPIVTSESSGTKLTKIVSQT